MFHIGDGERDDERLPLHRFPQRALVAGEHHADRDEQQDEPAARRERGAGYVEQVEDVAAEEQEQDHDHERDEQLAHDHETIA